MEFHEVIMKGLFQCEKGTSNPSFSSSDDGRLFYRTDLKKLYLNNGNSWVFFLDGESTINADTLEGYNSLYFAFSNHTHDDYNDRYLVRSNNLSDLTNLETARTNIRIQELYLKYQGWDVVTTNSTLDLYSRNIIHGGLTLSLLSSGLNIGDFIKFVPNDDIEEDNTILNLNSIPIKGISENLTIDINMPFSLVYVNSTYGWSIF